jgi:hypothetical protein
MMTETISPAESRTAESPRLARPETDAAALRGIELAKVDPAAAET